MAETAAAAPVSVVIAGTPWSMAALRTARSSKNDSRPSGVLMTSEMRPFSSSSPTCGRPSFTLKMMSALRPCARRYAAVPRVATSRKPRLESSRAIGTTPALSRLFTLMNAVPSCGSR